MARKGELFEEEKKGAGSLGPIKDDETLERGVPPRSPNEAEDQAEEVPRRVFKREDLKRGASVTRRDHDSSGIETKLERHGAVVAKAGDVRGQTDPEGERLWSVTAAVDGEHEAHGHIRREPEGQSVSKKEQWMLRSVFRKLGRSKRQTEGGAGTRQGGSLETEGERSRRSGIER